jgi:hypothetical protein
MNEIKSLMEKQFDERLEFLKEGFASMEKYNVRNIPDIMFRTYFLPYFSGEMEDSDNEVLSTWINIAGSTYSAVNILDNNGKVIARVPPIHDRDVISPIVNRNEDLSYIFKLAREKASLSPRLANNIVNDELNNRLNNLSADHDSSTLEKEWIELFQYYGKITINKKSKELDSDDQYEFEF